uniref:Putative secreted protein n=1 Tax=Ixodes ricinus TaxID=34613 RepID=A0A6B0USL8_IXORI
MAAGFFVLFNIIWWFWSVVRQYGFAFLGVRIALNMFRFCCGCGQQRYRCFFPFGKLCFAIHSPLTLSNGFILSPCTLRCCSFRPPCVRRLAPCFRRLANDGGFRCKPLCSFCCIPPLPSFLRGVLAWRATATFRYW